MKPNLATLLAPFDIIAPAIPLRHLQLDSREVAAGDLFIALPGAKYDGRHYINAAIKEGAVAILTPATNSITHGHMEKKEGVPTLYMSALKENLSYLASLFYQHPAEKLALIGITGTNGKTSTSWLIAQWSALLQQKSAVMGTNGNGIWGEPLQTAANTTASAITIPQLLAQYVQQGAKLAALEVSSHGVAQYRVSALPFAVTLFTNLTHEHLDYHETMAAYENAKWQLFSTHQSRHQVLNIDDEVGRRWQQQLPQAITVSLNPILFTRHSGAHFVNATNTACHDCGIDIQLNSSWGSGMLKTRLLGKFNAHNLLMAMAALLALDYSFDELLATSYQLTPICGRMERLIALNKPTIIVDYAHTPDALQKALQAAHAHLHEKGKIWCIFGCGGDRDRSKRALMGTIATANADQVIITNDNPRTEAVAVIHADILQGCNAKKSIVISDRKAAIHYALHNANTHDLILIAGKGHENYQIMGQKRIPYSDQAVVKAWFEENRS